MKFSSVNVLALILIIIFTACPQELMQETSAPTSAVTESGSMVLPLDASVHSGEFPNGLKYYIKVNNKPEARAELRLVINAGSVMEDDDQRGLAHLGEHMAFNGSKHFPENELINYLESVGMRFGSDLNAYTSFDEVVYMLQVPTDSMNIFRNGFTVLEDWAHWVSYNNEDIDAERKVVLEELRLGRGAETRIRDKQFPIIFKGSRYAERMPIGLPEVVANAPYDRLRSFYHEWYRPNLQAIIAVGDFNPDTVYNWIKSQFSELKNPDNFRPREYFKVPPHDDIVYAIAADPELDANSISLYYLQPAGQLKTENDLKVKLTERLYSSMFRGRLDDITRKPDAPFLFASAGKGSYVRTADVTYISAGTAENGIEKGFEAILTETERLKKYGFTESELERQKTIILRYMEKAYTERDKNESKNYAQELISYFLTEEAMPGIEKEYELTKQLLPEISLDDVNQLVSELLTEQNRVVVVSVPEKENIILPTEESLSAVIEKVNNIELTPYSEASFDKPLIDKLPTAGSVVSAVNFPDLNIELWTLSNGVKIYYKQTEFKNDQVLFNAFSPGGYSLATDANIMNARLASDFITEAGVGPYSKSDIQKKLAGKIVSVNPYIATLYEGFTGSFSPNDAETAFQLIYAWFASPRKDEDSYKALLTQYSGWLQNRNANPENIYQDSLSVIINNYSPRRLPLNVERVESADLDAMYAFFKDRFKDAGDFTFTFVGNISKPALTDFACRYLAALPVTGREEAWLDEGIALPAGVVKKEIYKGIEAKGFTQLVFETPFEWNRTDKYNLNAMTKVLGIRLREVLREEMGGTYVVRVSPAIVHYPRTRYQLKVYFGTDPGRIPEMTEAVFSHIDSIRTFGFSDVYIQKVLETEKRSIETDIQTNDYWLNKINSAVQNGDDLNTAFQYDDLWEQFTMQKAVETAAKFINPKEYVQVSLYPAQ